MNEKHTEFMTLALNEAKKAGQKSEVPIGAVLVAESGDVLSASHNEPCIMCMGAIVHARVSRVVFGAHDPKWGAAGSLYNIAHDTRLNHRPEIITGICEDECRSLIQDFFREKRIQVIQSLRDSI
jgi:tRNA(adenine34) deaminase